MRTLSIVALALSTALATPAPAQTPYPAFQPQTAADQLAAVMRRLATAPTDVYALVQAGELSVKLDDMSAAAAFFARADKIDGRNGRVKAGMASILVRAERPGEALRYFQLAEAFGLAPARFAADRGLAFDLLGEQERAQRDYRLALRSGPADDETVRRYALSLGIAGKRSLALEQVEPMVRRQDRAGWRVRAFVLAMDGDVAGANKIAAAVMPAGMAAGLRPFFDRLMSLPASDRAFAVHFGEVRPTPARLADARMKPFLPPLGPDLYAPAIRVAAVQPPPVPVAARGRDRRDGRRERVQTASSRIRTVGQPAQVAARPPAPRAVPGRVTVAPAAIAARPSTPPVQAPPAAVAPTPVQVASALPIAPGPPAFAQAAERPPAVAPVLVNPNSPAAYVPPPVRIASAAPVVATVVPGPGAVVTSFAAVPTTASASVAPAPVQSAPQPVALTAAPPSAAPAVAPGSTAPPPGAAAPALAAAAPGFTSPPPSAAPAAIPAAAPVTAVRSEDSILARIVASITVPGEELGVAEPVRRAVPAGAAIDPATKRTLAAGQAKVARESADRAVAARTIAAAAKAGARRRGAAAPEEAEAKPARGVRGATAVARKGARGQALAQAEEDEARPASRTRGGKVELASARPVRGRAAERRADEAEPRGAAGKRAADRKAATEEAAAKKEAARSGAIWVQVAGGAEQRDLPKAWTAAQRKAAALKGRDAYSTASRATNRVVTGPFKTEGEARAFVNQLARQGVSAFQFKSAAGQKMTKLPAK